MEGQPQKLPNARQRSQIETRTRLLDVAAHLFAKDGCNKTTTKNLASQAGVAVGTVYLHFGDKDNLLQELLKTAISHLKQEMGKISPGETDGFSLVQAKMNGLANFARRFPALAAVLFDPVNLASPAGQDAANFLTKSQENGLMAGISAGYYRGDLHSGLAARALVGILVQILGWWARNPQAASQTEIVELLTELRMNGLKSQG